MSPEPRDDVDPETWRDRLFNYVRDHSGAHHHIVVSPPAEGGSRDVDDDVETPVDPDELVAELEAETELRTDGGTEVVSDRCEDCGGPIDEPRLTPDGHPEGPNLVVCTGCEERHLNSDSDEDLATDGGTPSDGRERWYSTPDGPVPESEIGQYAREMAIAAAYLSAARQRASRYLGAGNHDEDLRTDGGTSAGGRERVVVNVDAFDQIWRVVEKRGLEVSDVELEVAEIADNADISVVINIPDNDHEPVTDGGRPAPIEDAHDRALQILENPGEHLPDDVKEELEELGIDPDDLDPSLGGVRGGLWREDVPAVVATILQRYDVPLEITARLSDDRYHWEVEWVRDEVVDYTEREDLEYVPGGDLR